MIDWNDNAKAAVREFAGWLFTEYQYLSEVGKFIKQVEKQTQTKTKTVADAVAENDGKWPLHDEFDTLWYTEKFKAYGCFQTQSEDLVRVCTREQFEAYAKEQEDKQEGEKWTHEYHGDNCRIVHKEKWQAWIVSENGLSKLVPISELRKPKPAITKEQAWDMLLKTDESIRKLDDAIFAIADKYDII